MTLKFYGKKTCITCQKAKAYLEEAGLAFEEIPIEQTPPSRALLESLVDAENIKAALNTRSKAYKDKGLGEKIPAKQTVIDWMLADPNLIKRPVIVKPDGQASLGFDPKHTPRFLKG